MIKYKKFKIKKIAAALLIVLLLFFIFNWLMSALNLEQAKNFVNKLGIFGPFLIILYIIVSHILAPIAGTPGVLLGAVLFGVIPVLFFIYLAQIISAAVCFWISRKFGRAMVIKLAGGKTMREIDNFTEYSGEKILILSRLFGFSLFEILSYAFGLTKISFKKYFFITVFYSAFPILIFGYFFKNFDLQSIFGLTFWIGSIFITGIIFTFFLKRFLKLQKKL
jgi:uncharacterized membrane protein YdjX (TVP38/TMEM64 family)